jgi:hypothetical protein
MKISIRLDVEQEDIPIEGNVLASGDEKQDREAEEEVRRRLDQGDVWAWAYVKIEARIVLDGQAFIGKASLGGCSYKDEADFKAGGYYDDLKNEVIEDMWQCVREATKRGLVASGLLIQKQRETFEIEEES